MGLTLQDCLEMADKGQRVIVHNGAITGYEIEKAPSAATE